jgi:hypothetical protein
MGEAEAGVIRMEAAMPDKLQLQVAKQFRWDEDRAEHYRLFREYVQHEDDLINHRSTWHNTIQGLLFTALAFALQWKPETADNPHAALLQKTLTILLPLLGIGNAWAGYLSIRAATKALDALNQKWTKICETYSDESKHSLPPLTGAGDKWAIKWGKAPAFSIPLLIGAAWIVLLEVSVGILLTRAPSSSPQADAPARIHGRP